MIILSCILSAVIGYLMGSINSAILTVKLLKHEDIRNFGSGNAGLTNTLRCFGKGCALITLIGDLSKGMIAVLLSQMFGKMLSGADTDLYLLGCIAGIFAMLGHMFPLYHGFKGGKGVLVSVSIFLILDWRVFLVLIGIFAIILIISKYVSLASIIATACCPFVTFGAQYFLNDIHHQEFTLNQMLLHFGLLCIMAGMIIFMHRSNIERLKNGTESKIGQKGKKLN
ncbi:MAG: glycerol-3-phosphate 1-O-acyltransferase PlsY [Oscillospiraceae bacterium]|nr:glycerol-3-phosphate 1-O-acyltransferase PlsY [Oscillospiraceae bacterium]MBR7084388.1 glycerol-3-phosphate 1-O-acyltransferase PlsY [Oscillospiraceae bacterium]